MALNILTEKAEPILMKLRLERPDVYRLPCPSFILSIRPVYHVSCQQNYCVVLALTVNEVVTFPSSSDAQTHGVGPIVDRGLENEGQISKYLVGILSLRPSKDAKFVS